MPVEPVIQVAGPWTHRSVTANGCRFHVATIGEGPLVLLLHGFPEFWWTWRHQLVTLAEAGYRAVAVDLRGYGDSDKPPRGYDLITAAADAAGLIRALGEANATVVGHDWGGLTAWTLAAYFPKAVRRLAVVSMAHPLRMRARVLSSPLRISRALAAPDGPARRGGYPLAFQVPMLPERLLVRDGGALVGSILSSWSAPGWPDQETAGVYQHAMRIPPVAHTSLEYQRWFVRSTFRPDGLRYARQMRSPVAAPVLHLHGAADFCIPPSAARGAGRYVEGPYRWKIIDGAGHFPHEERPESFDAELLGWLADPEPDQVTAPAGRDRDPAGRARNARPRDELGRPLPKSAAQDVSRIPDDLVVTAAEAADLGGRLLAEGRPFHAHEVFEAAWKSLAGPERELWRGLAQIAVGLTHARRGNAGGSVALLRRGAGHVAAFAGTSAEVDAGLVAAEASDLALRIERDGLDCVAEADLRLALRPGRQ